MKINFTLILSFLFVLPGFSQSVISDVVPDFGDQMVYNQKDGAPDPGASGANVTWDFSDFTLDDFSANYLVSHPGDVEGSDQFPDATMVWVVDLDFAVLNNYMSFANNAFTNYGSISISSGQTSGRIYDNPEVSFTYPINYQDTGSDTYDGNVVISSGNSPFSGESSYVVDGYGTIVTPYGTFENVLRITSTKTENLSTFGLNMTSNITETSWYSPDYRVPVYIISSTLDSYMGSEIDSSKTATALVSYTGTTGIRENSSDNFLNIYPNPSRDHITISSDFKGFAELRIYSVDGKVVARKSVSSEEIIDISSLNKGFYIADITVDGHSYSRASFVVD